MLVRTRKLSRFIVHNLAETAIVDFRPVPLQINMYLLLTRCEQPVRAEYLRLSHMAELAPPFSRRVHSTVHDDQQCSRRFSLNSVHA